MKKKLLISESVYQKRWKRFKSIKRAYYSLIILLSIYIFSLLSPYLFIGNKAVVVKYNNEFVFPIFKFYSEKYFNQSKNDFAEANYRKLQETLKNDSDANTWAIIPVYPYSPIEILLSEIDGNVPSEPDLTHFFGTDQDGRDVLARIFYAFPMSITYAFILTILSYIIGITTGALFGYLGGLFDLIGQRLMDILSAIPGLYMIMILKSFLKPKTPFDSIFLLICLNLIFAWMGISYYVRGEFYKERSKDYVAASIAMGATTRRVLFKHIFPNSLTPVITSFPFSLIGAIDGLVALDYLGFGLNPPTPSWGETLAQGQSNISNWWLIASPAGATFLTLLIITFIGEGIREAFDPKEFSRLR